MIGAASFDTRLKRSLLALCLAVVLALGGLRASDLAVQRRQALEKGERHAAGLGLILGEYLHENFASIDYGLREVAAFARSPDARSAPEERWTALLEAQRARLGLTSISVTDADGVIRHSTLARLIGQGRGSDPLFRRTAAGPLDSLAADVPIQAQTDPQRILIPVGRRLVTADGRFAGAAVASFDPRRLHAFFQHIDLGPTGTLSLFHPSGAVLLSEPPVEPAVGRSAQGTPLLAALEEASAPRVVHGPLIAGGPEKITALRPIESPDSVLAVSLDRSEVLAEWRHAVAVSSAILGVVALLLWLGLRMMAREIDARRRAQLAEGEVRVRQRELQTFIDSMSTLNAKVALDGRLLMVNRVARLAAGIDEEQLLGSDFLTGPWWTFDPEVAARVREAFARACAGETVNYDERLFAFGRIVDINFGLAPVLGADGEVAYLVAEARDITLLKQSESETARRTLELEAAYAELESFSYSVSHDLRAPLRAIAGFVNVIREDHSSQLSEEGLRQLRVVGDNAERMGALIDDLLCFSRLGRVGIASEPVDMTALAASVVDELADDPRLCSIPAALPSCGGDSALLRQVWINLISNALKFSRRSSPPRVEITGMLTPQGATYSVRDNGVGFAMEHTENLFGVFQRLHDEADFEGTGVGLAIVKRIVERHGGRVWADSIPEQGATFSFELPVGAAEPLG